MKIVLQRENNASDDSGEDDASLIRDAFAPYADKILIQTVSSSAGEIVVEYERQKETASVDFEKIIEEAVTLSKKLILMDLEIPNKILKIPAIKAIIQREESVTYEVLPFFTAKLAEDESYRKEVANPQVVEVNYVYEVGACSGELKNNKVDKLISISNAYNKLARAMCNDEALRNDVLLDNFAILLMTIRSNGTFNLSVMTKALEEDNELDFAGLHL